MYSRLLYYTLPHRTSRRTVYPRYSVRELSGPNVHVRISMRRFNEVDDLGLVVYHNNNYILYGAITLVALAPEPAIQGPVIQCGKGHLAENAAAARCRSSASGFRLLDGGGRDLFFHGSTRSFYVAVGLTPADFWPACCWSLSETATCTSRPRVVLLCALVTFGP